MEMEKKRKILRFNIHDDIILLKETIAHNPFEDISRWDALHASVVNATGKQFTKRSVKEHLDHLLELFIKQDLSNLRKSGTEEQYGEKENLLQEVRSLRQEFKKIKNKTIKTLGMEIRNKALIQLNQSNEEELTETTNIKDSVSSPRASSSQQPEEIEELNTYDVGPISDDVNYSKILQPPRSVRANDNIYECTQSSPQMPQSYSDNSGGKKFSKKTKMTDYLLKKQKIEERKLSIEERRMDIEERKINLREREQKIRDEQFKAQQKVIEMLIAKLGDK